MKDLPVAFFIVLEIYQVQTCFKSSWWSILSHIQVSKPHCLSRHLCFFVFITDATVTNLRPRSVKKPSPPLPLCLLFSFFFFFLPKDTSVSDFISGLTRLLPCKITNSIHPVRAVKRCNVLTALVSQGTRGKNITGT